MLQHPRQLGRLVAAVVVVFAVAGCQSSGGSGPASDTGGLSPDAQKISDLLDRYSQALLNKDLVTLDQIWADDLSFINLRGELLNKQNRMENVRTGATAFKSIRLTDKRIRVYGPAALATFKVSLDAQYSGQEGSGDYGVTAGFARPKGTWQIVALQMTRIVQ